MSTLAKSHIKREAFNELGNRLDDILEDIKTTSLKAEGAATAVGGLAPKIQKLHGHVDKDVEEGVIKDLQVAKLVKLYVTRAMNICKESARNAEEVKLKLRSKAEGIAISLGETKKFFDREDATIQQVTFLAKCAEGEEQEQVLETQDSSPQPTSLETTSRKNGERPNLSIKARRQAEALREEILSQKVTPQRTPHRIKEVPKPEVKESQEDPVQPETDPSPEISQDNPLEEIKRAKNAALRADNRYQCGVCQRHFKSWDDLIEHCTLEEHVPRSPKDSNQ